MDSIILDRIRDFSTRHGRTLVAGGLPWHYYRLAEMDRIIAAQLERSGRRRVVWILDRLPDPFAVLRFLNRWALKYRYPPEGWRFEWVEDSDRCLAYDACECFYVNILTAQSAPELTAHLCAVDDLADQFVRRGQGEPRVRASLPSHILGRTLPRRQGQSAIYFPRMLV